MVDLVRSAPRRARPPDPAPQPSGIPRANCAGCGAPPGRGLRCSYCGRHHAPARSAAAELADQVASGAITVNEARAQLGLDHAPELDAVAGPRPVDVVLK